MNSTVKSVNQFQVLTSSSWLSDVLLKNFHQFGFCANQLFYRMLLKLLCCLGLLTVRSEGLPSLGKEELPRQ